MTLAVKGLMMMMMMESVLQSFYAMLHRCKLMLFLIPQVSSQEGHQGGGSQSDSSHGQDAEDEGSNSFPGQEDNDDEKSPTQQNPSPPATFFRPTRNLLLSRYPGQSCLDEDTHG